MQPYIIGVRILLCLLFGYWGFRLWRGTTSWTARGVGVLFSAAVIAQIVVDAWS